MVRTARLCKRQPIGTYSTPTAHDVSRTMVPRSPVQCHSCPRAIALTSRSAVRTVGISPCEGIRCAIPARVAEGRQHNSTLSGEGIALHHCWASCPHDPSVPPGEKHPFGSFSARQRRTVLDSTPLLVPAMSRTRETCSAVRFCWISTGGSSSSPFTEQSESPDGPLPRQARP
jgi:hypothetical protein